MLPGKRLLNGLLGAFGLHLTRQYDVRPVAGRSSAPRTPGAWAKAIPPCSRTCCTRRWPTSPTWKRSVWTKRRQEHLDSLGLDLAGRTVLEVGAGIGDHTTFFLDRGCRVLSTDGRPENLAGFRERDDLFTAYPHRDCLELAVLDLDRPPADFGRSFEVVYCYGVLYHLEHPGPRSTSWPAAAPRCCWWWRRWSRRVPRWRCEKRGRRADSSARRCTAAAAGRRAHGSSSGCGSYSPMSTCRRRSRSARRSPRPEPHSYADRQRQHGADHGQHRARADEERGELRGPGTAVPVTGSKQAARIAVPAPTAAGENGTRRPPHCANVTSRIAASVAGRWKAARKQASEAKRSARLSELPRQHVARVAAR